MLDSVAESFSAEPFTKCIVTAVFLFVAALIMIIDRSAFGEGPCDFTRCTDESGA